MRFLLLITMVFPLSLLAQKDTFYKGIKWVEGLTWEQVKQKAKTENKYIFVDCYTTWCGPCKKMEKDVYSTERIGNEINSKFISVKVQMDTTVKDDEQIKKWYAISNAFKHDYLIEGYPTYLFFAPDGQIVHKDIGYMQIKDFIRVSQLALDPQKKLYMSQLEDYKKGQKNYASVGELAKFTKNLIGDKKLALEIANDYKKNYLENVADSILFSKNNFEFIRSFPDLVHSNDRYFQLAYNNPKLFDSLFNYPKASEIMVKRVIQKEELADKILIDSKAKRKPAWQQLQHSLAKKYQRLDAKKLVLEYKLKYYHSIYPDWVLWAKYKDEMIKTYPHTPPYGLSVYIDLNAGAWDAFLNCNNKSVLKKALKWVDLAIQLEGKKAAYLDTKANILYKLDKTENALSTQKEALQLSSNDKEIAEAYQKMQRGEPTWNMK